jgi:hypothetical protein
VVISAARTLVVLALVVATAPPSSAEIGILILEPVGTLGFFTRVGHTATYLSNVCPDRSPVKMRLCRPGERGSVVSRYAPFSEHENYDWAIVPFDAYLHGLESPELAPLIATRKLQDVVERYNFDRLFVGALTPRPNGELPSGQWKATLANRFVRSFFIFSVKTTPEEDAAIVAEFNAAPNASCFNFFYGNCSNQTKRLFKLVLPNIVGDRVGGMTMEVPKGLVKALVHHVLEHPELEFRVQRYPQLPGTFPPSRGVLFPLENTYKSIALAPWWYYDGFRVAAVGAMLYHQVISPFNVRSTARAFISPRAARLTAEQTRLRRRQDDVRRAFSRAVTNSEPWTTLARIDAGVSRRLDEIRREQRAEVSRVEGSKADWRARRRDFQSLLRGLGKAGLVPADVRPLFARAGFDGQLARTLIQYFEAAGEFSIGELGHGGRGPWLTLRSGDGQPYGTGLSRAEVLSGDPRAAVLVLASVLDSNLNGASSRREDIAQVDDLLALLRTASQALDPRAVAGG